MRKKILGIMAVTLTASMMAASLTGCGTQAKATDQDVAMDEETIVVTEQEEDAVATVTEDGITATEEVIADDGEADGEAEASYTEHEFCFALDE